VVAERATTCSRNSRPPETRAEALGLSQLKQQGILTDEEFEAKKKAILGV
jgi:hypothetical protein